MFKNLQMQNKELQDETKANSEQMPIVAPPAQMPQNPLLPAVAWQEIGADDFAATSGCKRYYFRAEQMDKKLWWWSVDCLSELIGDSWQSDVVAKTKKDAFSLAEKCYHTHLRSNQ